MNNFESLQKMQEETDVLVKNYFTDRGEPDKRYFDDRLCPVCVSAENVFLFTNRAGYYYVRCAKCRMVFMSPILKQDLVESLYLNSRERTAKHQLWQESVKRLKPIDKPMHSERFDLLTKHTHGGVLLDFGCGFGRMADKLKFFFDKVEGLEIDPYCAKQAEEIYNIKVYNDFIENLKFHNKYDACFCYNNIEHLYDPQMTLRCIHRGLKKNGIIFIECPLIDSLSIRLFKCRHHLLRGNEHINMFSLGTLFKLLLSVGFVPIESRARKLDITANDLAVYIFKRKEFYHRCSSPLTDNKVYAQVVNFADKVFSKAFTIIRDRGCNIGSYIQIVAKKSDER